MEEKGRRSRTSRLFEKKNLPILTQGRNDLLLFFLLILLPLFLSPSLARARSLE